MFKKFIALLFFICCYFPTTSEACSCRDIDDQYSLKVFCYADWVAEVTVTDTKEFTFYYEFSITYTTVYKMPSKFNETFPTKIYSNLQRSACGVKLLENMKFILVGRINSALFFEIPVGKIGINTCSYLDSEFKEKLRYDTPSINCSEIKNPWN